MDDERMNVFQRNQRPQANLADDRQNKFDRHVELQKKKRIASDTQEERIARNAEQRAGWVGPGRSDVRTSSGIKVTDDLKELKAASDASRAAARAPELDAEDTAAIAAAFRISTPEFYPSAFNATNLFNCAMHAVAAGKIRWSVRGLREVSSWLEKNGYYEGRPGDAARGAPRVFEEYLDPEQRELEAQRQAFAAALVDEADRRRAAALPFEELRDQVHRDNKKFATRQDY